MHELNVNFPIIIKPSVCSGQRKNVTIVKSQRALDEYLKENENENASNYMVQNYLSDEYDTEIGVLWEKMPWEKEGEIIEINAQPKYKKNKDELTKQDERDQRDRLDKKVETFNYLITDDLNKLFNDISKQIRGFNAGRYDILIKSPRDFQNGDFKILEVNGIWGAQATMYEMTFGTTKWFLRRFVIGLGNMVTLRGYSPLTLLRVMFESYARSIVCGNQLAMFSLYI
jgi:biotin carboxylase